MSAPARDLFAVVFQLAEGPLPAALHVRGWLYHQIREHAPDLHDENGPMPFTVSVISGEHSSVRLTFLRANLYLKLEPVLRELQVLPLAAPHRVVGFAESGHRWAGASSFATLLEGVPSADAHLQFASPTSFRRKGSSYPLPEPRLVFGSLRERWNAHAPVPVPEELGAALTERLTLRHLALRSRGDAALHMIGCTGRATYHLPRATPEEARWLTALARFAFFSGVGAKTTAGFGRARLYRAGVARRK